MSISNTEVILIGTTHFETENFKAKNLLNTLELIKPELILLELPPNYLTNDYSYVIKPEDDEVEGNAVEMYLKKYKADLRAYDITGRNDFLKENNIFNKCTRFEDVINNLKIDELENRESFYLYQKWKDLQKLYKALYDESIRVYNSKPADIFFEMLDNFDCKEIFPLLENVKILNEHLSYWKKWKQFEYERNQSMVENILAYIMEFKNKKIVITCGCLHKYFIKRELAKREKDLDFTLKEYWSYNK